MTCLTGCELLLDFLDPDIENGDLRGSFRILRKFQGLSILP